MVATDAGWKTVTPYPKAGDKRRSRFLDLTDRTALLFYCADDLRALVTALLLTGARPGEIANANAADLDVRQGTLRLSASTGPAWSRCPLRRCSSSRRRPPPSLPTAPLLADAYGNRWKKGFMEEALQGCGARREPADVRGAVRGAPHGHQRADCRRHGFCSPSPKLAGTSTMMIDKHYGHLRHEQTRARLDAVALM